MENVGKLGKKQYRGFEPIKIKPLKTEQTLNAPVEDHDRCHMPACATAWIELEKERAPFYFPETYGRPHERFCSGLSPQSERWSRCVFVTAQQVWPRSQQSAMSLL